MEQTHAFLLELGLEIKSDWHFGLGISDFGLGISDFGRGDPKSQIPNPKYTEGGYSLEFERLSKLLELPIDLETDFIPVDLFDFENKEDDDNESSAQKSPTQRSQSKASFMENRRHSISDFGLGISVEDTSNPKSETQNPKYTEGGGDLIFFEEKQAMRDDIKRQRPNVGEVSNLPDVNDIDAEAKRNAAIKPQRPNVGEVSNLPDVDAINAINDVDADAQSAIWQNPLGNLSSFAALSNSITPTATPMDLSFLKNNQTRYDKPNTEEKTIEEAVFGQKRKHIDTATARQVDNVSDTFKVSDTLDQPFAPYFDNIVYEKKQMLYPEDTVENDDFLPINKENTLAADTDDLLDALTERIRRDFNRFYP